MWLILAFVAFLLVEIALFVQIGGMIGLWATLIWVVLSAGLGLIVLKGVASLGPVSLSRDMTEMRDPMSPLAHRLLVAIGGGLLVIPGFLSDLIGLILLIPPLRGVVMRLVARRLDRIRSAHVHGSMVIDGDWQEVDPPRAPGAAPTPPDSTRH
jgi:UPF0716 protein FxsA